MKNYIMIILATLITSIMLNNANIVKADVSTDLSVTPKTASISTLGSLEEKETEKIISSANISIKTTTAVKTSTAAKTSTNTTSANTNYTVTKTIKTADEYNNTAYSLSYSDIYKFRKMVYGHNTQNLLGGLTTKNVGDTISITDENGTTTTYKVVFKDILEKVSATTLKSTSNGAKYEMNDITFAMYSYDLTLETCYGYGNTPYRLVLFLNKI